MTKSHSWPPASTAISSLRAASSSSARCSSHDLVDELRLKVFPVVLGTGGRMFGQASGKKPLRLVDAQTIDGGIACLTYEPVRAA